MNGHVRRSFYEPENWFSALKAREGMSKVRATLITAVIAVAGLVACGSGGGEVDAGSSETTAGPESSPTSSPGTSTTTGASPDGPKGEFIASADAVCTETTKKSAALAIDLNAIDRANIAAQADAIEQSATFSEEALASLRALTPPQGDEGTVTGFWDGVEGQVTGQRQVAAQVRANDLQGAQTTIQQIQTTGKQLTVQLESYGFVACAN